MGDLNVARRKRLITRDGDLCCYCGRHTVNEVGSNKDYASSVEHIVPKVYLTSTQKNIDCNSVIACRKCNSKRSCVFDYRVRGIIKRISTKQKYELYSYVLLQDQTKDIIVYTEFLIACLNAESAQQNSKDISLYGKVRTKEVPEEFNWLLWVKQKISNTLLSTIELRGGLLNA